MKRLLLAFVLLTLALLPLSSLSEGIQYPLHYEEPITITAIRQEVGGTGVFTGENVDYENNVWTQELLDRYNIEVKYLWVVDASQYQTKLNLTLASGELPDVMNVGITQLASLVLDGLAYDMSELFKGAPERVLNYCGGLNTLAYLAASDNGEGLYGIPYAGGNSMRTMNIRKDWLDKLQLDVPQTFEDVIEIARAFALQDPDGNGLQDTVGLPVPVNVYVANTALYNSFHAYPEYYYEGEDGALVYGTVQPQMKAALARLRELYAEGVVYPEFGTATEAQLVADSKQGIVFGFYWTPLTTLQNAVSNDPEAQWITLPLLSVDEQPVLVQNPQTASYNYIVTSAECAHPEAILQMMDMYGEFFLEANTEEIFTRFVNDVNGNEVWQACAPPARMDYALRGIAMHKQIAQLMAGTIDPATTLVEARSVFERIKSYQAGDTSLWCWEAIYKDSGPLYWESYYLDNGFTLDKANIGAPTETQLNKDATLQKILQEGFMAIIKGADIETFDAVVANWYSAGGQDILDELNAWYESIK